MDQTKPSSPIYAEIVDANDDRTAAVLVLFGRSVRREFRGQRHLSDARHWVAGWNSHLRNEWNCVRDAAAVTLDAFTTGLTRRGVHEDVIQDTLLELSHYGD